ncbi:MAG: RNase adapter RapZ [Deltaproteobacteria bacterium]|nr:RNase adapter RapZ [Deltaproteobacteria bacterium]
MKKNRPPHEGSEIIIVSGMSGSGKSSVLNTLEDMGYFAIDNLPGNLFLPLLDSQKKQKASSSMKRLAIAMDAREEGFLRNFQEYIEALQTRRIPFKLIFLDARDGVILRRFSETRRRHPLAPSGRVSLGIQKERLLLNPLRAVATHHIDTSSLNVHQLRERTLQLLKGDRRLKDLSVTLISFGYRYGLPLESDLVFDVRFLPNPHFIKDLRPFSGLNKKVSRFVLCQKETKAFLPLLKKLFTLLLKQYVREGKTYLTIAFGCTGGKHRSVAISERFASDLKVLGYPVKIMHRDVKRED